MRRFMSERSNELNGCQHFDRVFFPEKALAEFTYSECSPFSNRLTVSKGFDR